jgi:hypothetical protein
MKHQILTLSFGLGALLLATQHAFAQNANCAPHDAVVARLAERYGETRQSIGIAQNNSVVEVFASAETGTWTITVTMPNGPTCLVAAGAAFENVVEALPPVGAPA